MGLVPIRSVWTLQADFTTNPSKTVVLILFCVCVALWLLVAGLVFVFFIVFCLTVVFT